ncbi:VWA domain-containing protein [Caldinitratiruptor microaerophilus]|uniref:VWA domain-containing protein n=1 Tax=Caldinitratiruptor microaerophilus TaxID=671077 RepID=A0AA35G897_9FIRM|nr:VWA domain-containing protein [Caldinitratiruptor microaerophilus]BDG60846.1 VWA domain-containing protein [Caldinitratiruptor microaerophilus]
MSVEFQFPARLLLLLPALAWVWAARRAWLRAARRAGRAAWRRQLRHLAVRGLVVLLVGLALAEPALVRRLSRQTVVLVLDASASTAPVRDRVEAWARRALDALPPGDRAAVVAVGAAAAVEEAPAADPVFSRLGARVDPGGSDLAAGLELAGALVPAGFAGRVVLVSDGRATGADPEAAARALAAAGMRVDVVPVGEPPAADTRLEAVELPEVAYAGEESTLVARVRAASAAAGTLRVYRDGALVAERQARLAPGLQALTVAVPVGPAGLHRYRVAWEPDDPAADPVSANDALGAVQRVGGPPRVAVVAPGDTEVRALTAALRAAGAGDVERLSPGAVPQDLAGWAAYEAAVLANVPATALPPGAMEALEAYVRDLGRGLAMVGGPDSYGLGGYAGTPVERALPVYMDLRGRGRLPRLALVVVIDKSGSMSGGAGEADKMGLAKEAALRSVRLLRPRDTVGVLAFDTVPQWVVGPRPVGEGAGLAEAIGSIYADGGTEIYPALMAAYQALAAVDADLRHIILLTDGRSGSTGDYPQLIEAMRQARITLSGVAVGSDADQMLLEALSRAGGGRYYFTADPSSIPEIFAKETALATRSFIVDGTFYPAAASPSPLLEGLREVPPLQGYVATTPKERAEVVLVSPEGDPVLAAWQYGSGRALAWTPDAGGRWAGSWASAQAFVTLWGNALSWLLPGGTGGGLTLHARPQPDGTVEVVAEAQAGWTEVRPTHLTVIGPGGQRQEVEMRPAGPGTYRAALAGLEPGAYVARAVQEAPGGLTLRAEAGWVMPYPAEFRETGVDRARLERIARAGGGRVLTDPAALHAERPAPVRAPWPLGPALLAAGALLWFVDVAGRRLVLTAEDRAAALAWLRRRLWQPAESVPAGAATPTLGHLQAARSRAEARRLRRLAPLEAGTPPGRSEPSAAAPGGPGGGRPETGAPHAGAGAQPAGPRGAGGAPPGDTAARLLARKRERQTAGTPGRQRKP